MTWWWLSFCDPERQAGSQFIGVAIVDAPGPVQAVDTAWAMDCNPGGEVAMNPIPEEEMDDVPARLRYRLLSEAELRAEGLI